MKTLLVLTCCLALTGLVRAEQDNENKGRGKVKKTVQTTQQAVTAATPSVGGPTGKKYQALSNASQVSPGHVKKSQGLSNASQVSPGHVKKSQGLSNASQIGPGHMKKQTVPAVQSSAQVQANTQINANVNTKPWKVQKYTLQKNTSVTPVRFGATTRIVGANNWQGPDYNAFRIYTSQRRDRSWWMSNHSRIILSGGGYYYWDNGYWYPAWGYDPRFEFYAYDGPIYGYNGLPPDQVIANVQASLQRQGYYHGFVDGLLGPLTRAALANYQRDHGLYITSAIDRPTLRALGMT